jgi:hypothetical protein
MIRGRFNSHHIRQLREIASLVGFTGDASVGVALNTANVGANIPTEQEAHDDIGSSQELQDLQAEEEEQEHEEQMNNDLLDILTISTDLLTARI